MKHGKKHGKKTATISVEDADTILRLVLGTIDDISPGELDVLDRLERAAGVFHPWGWKAEIANRREDLEWEAASKGAA